MLTQWVYHNFLTASRLHRMDFPVRTALDLFGMIPSHRKRSPAAILLRKSQLKAIGGPQARQEPYSFAIKNMQSLKRAKKS